MENLPQQDVYPADPRPEVAPHVPEGLRSALDVGCGRGGFGATLRSRMPAEAWVGAVEAVADNAAEARSHGTFDEVYEGYFPAVMPPDLRVDLISFLDVLEHMNDPWTALRATHAHLTEGGRVLAAIPNIQYWPVVNALVKGRWDYEDTGVLDRTHVRFFTRATMREMFEETGYAVESCEGVNSLLETSSPKEYTRYRRLRRWLPDMQWQQYVVVARSLEAAG